MLVFTRTRDEAVLVGSGDQVVRVVIVDVRGDRVRLGFEAPIDVDVDREEVREAVLKEGRGRRRSIIDRLKKARPA